MNVLITGAGGAATPILINLLREKGDYNPILADMNLTPIIKSYDAPSVQIPAGNSKDFISAISKIVDEYSINAIIPGVDEELLPLAKHYSKSTMPLIISPEEDIIKLTLNKYKLNKFLQKKGISVPDSRHLIEFNENDEDFLNKPLIAKPVFGRGSRGIYFSSSATEARYLAKYLSLRQPDSMFQEMIIGEEYTVSMICSRSGEVLGVVPKKIIVKRGITISAITEKNPIVESYCKQLQEALSATGPLNIQLIIDEEGTPYLFEINPRISTTTILTIKAGFDEIGVAIRGALGEELPSLEWKEGVILQRSWDTHFYTESQTGRLNL